MDWHLLSEDAGDWLDSENRIAAPRTWNPLLDIAAANQVRDRLQERGWRSTASQYGGEGWQVAASNDKLDECAIGDIAPELSEAICGLAISLLVGPLDAEYTELSGAEYIED